MYIHISKYSLYLCGLPVEGLLAPALLAQQDMLAMSPMLNVFTIAAELSPLNRDTATDPAPCTASVNLSVTTEPAS